MKTKLTLLFIVALTLLSFFKPFFIIPLSLLILAMFFEQLLIDKSFRTDLLTALKVLSEKAQKSDEALQSQINNLKIGKLK